MIIYQKEVSNSLTFADSDDGSITISQADYGYANCVRLNEAESIALYQFLCVKFGAS